MILFLSTMNGYSWGGSEELWYEAALYAKANGHDVKAVVFGNLPVHDKFKALKLKDIEVMFVARDQQAIVPGLLKRIALKVLRKEVPITYTNRFNFIKHLQPEFIVLSQGGATDITYYSDLKTFFSNSTVPFYTVNHFNGEYGSLDDEQRKYLRELFTKSKKNFFVAHRNKEVLERQLACKIREAHIAKNPVNITSCKVQHRQNTTLSFAVVGRLDVNHKGQDVLLQCLSGDKWKSRNFKLNIYGKGKDETYLSDLINFYNLADKASLKGHVNNVEAIWQNNDVLILPSLGEGLPLTIIEAMLCGRPCVVTDVGDSALLIEDNVNGWIANCASVRALDDALERAWQQQPSWQQMGQMAHNKAAAFIVAEPGKTFFNQLIA